MLESLAADGVYRSQFATGISNGGLTAHPGGDRWRWESRLFAGRYDHSHPHERPVYGAWNRRGDPNCCQSCVHWPTPRAWTTWTRRSRPTCTAASRWTGT
ncbi:DUF3626 domain-containing protein [Ruania albidiflava]|uniref:DUF3626 domain-containing protein n=1 Tax=Ruania albidiflava TaxID=366586 RepID=UPI003CCC2030